MTHPNIHAHRSILSERPSLANVSTAPISSTSLPSTTFAPPSVVRIHTQATRSNHPLQKTDSTTPTGARGKENVAEDGAVKASVTSSPSRLSSPTKPTLQVVIDPRTPDKASPAAASTAVRESTGPSGRLSFARPTERVLTIHTISDRESLARLSVEPSVAAPPAPSFRYSLRSSFRPYQWSANGTRQSAGGQARPSMSNYYTPQSEAAEPLPTAQSTSSSSPPAAAPPSPPPSRSPSPPLHTPSTGTSLHRRQLSARKERDGVGLEPRRLQHTTGPLATPHLSTFASSPSSFTSPLPLSHPRVSTTPLLLSTAQSSSFSTLPYYRSPSMLVPNSPPHSTAHSLAVSYPKVEEIKEEPRALSLGLTAATDSNPSFRAFVASNA